MFRRFRRKIYSQEELPIEKTYYDIKLISFDGEYARLVKVDGKRISVKCNEIKIATDIVYPVYITQEYWFNETWFETDRNAVFRCELKKRVHDKTIVYSLDVSTYEYRK